MRKSTVTPVVLFTFSRYKQLAQTLECIRNNKVPELYVFSDGPRNKEDVIDIEKVRELIDAITWTKVTKVYLRSNKGLSQSIQDGLDKVFQKYDQAIILEDDVCVAPGFYNYMTKCLATYRGNPSIAGVTGLRYPFSKANLDSDQHPVFLSPRFSSWGWGTWKETWQTISFDLKDLRRISHKKLASGGSDLPEAISELKAGRLTGCWDVYFFMNMAKRSMYFIWPKKNYILNVGLTEGVHADGAVAPPWVLKWETTARNSPEPPESIHINAKIMADFLAFFLPENLTNQKHEPASRGSLISRERFRMKKPVRNVLNSIVHKTGYHIARVSTAPAAVVVETPAPSPVSSPPITTKAKPDPKDYSTTDDPQEVPCQKEAYYHALNTYIKPSWKVLDVGSGLGYGAAILSVIAAEVQGVDVDKKAVKHARTEFVGRNPKIKDIQSYDGYHLPFPDNTFDMVTCVDVLEHVEDYHAFIDELLRVSKKLVMFSTPNRRKEFTNPDGSPKNIWHLREWSHPELDRIIQDHVRKVDWNFVDGPWDGPFRVVSRPSKDTLVLMPVLHKLARKP